MKDFHVVIAGCGAVGSRIALLLAEAGVGRLTLIDEDRMGAENVARHPAGVRFLGRPKVDAIKTMIGERSPHVIVQAKPCRIEDALNDDGLKSPTVIVLATGDETLERRMATELRRVAPLVHVWVEPLGLGGHVIASRPESPGCYECLFDRTDEGVLHNTASFAAPGQDFTRAIAGCTGRFTPFSGLDAERAAVEGARAVVVFVEGNKDAALIGWIESSERFVAEGYRLSSAGMNWEQGTRRRLLLQSIKRITCVCVDGAPTAEPARVEPGTMAPA